MRSVVVFFQTATNEILAKWLDQVSQSQRTPWLVLSIAGDPILYADLLDAPGLRLESNSKELPFSPTAGVAIDMSGRHRGSAEVLELVTRLLADFDGVATDDFSKKVWTLAEIERKESSQGSHFFDRLGSSDKSDP